MHPDLKQINPQVLNYKYKHFDFKNDLSNLLIAWESKLYEATVLYAARILETLSVSTLENIKLDYSENTFSNLLQIERYNLAPGHILFWAHSLRRLGNKIRHVMDIVKPLEVETNIAFLYYWITWYFCRYQFSPHLPSIVKKDPLLFIKQKWLLKVVEDIDKDVTNFDVLANQIMKKTPGYKKIVSIPAILSTLIERMISRNLLSDAEILLDIALNEHPTDLRLIQLKGLYYSHTNQLEKAQGILEPLHQYYKNDDELIGILAGIYKRMWMNDRKNNHFLEKSHELYATGWKNDRNNYYLGINTATLNLFIGKKTLSIEKANTIKSIILHHKATMERIDPAKKHEFTLWELLTMAEAEILCGNGNSAYNYYKYAIENYKTESGSIMTFKNQLKLIKEFMGAEWNKIGFPEQI